MKKIGNGILNSLIPLFTVSFVSHIAPYIYIPSLPDIAKSLGISISEAGGMMSAYYLALSVTLLFAGAVGDMWNKGKILTAASLIIAFGSLLGALPTLYVIVLAGWALQGVGAAAITIVGQTWIGQCSDKGNLTSRFSYLSIALSFAPLIAPVVGGMITEALSWKYNFFIVSFLCFLSAMFIYKNISLAPTPIRKANVSLRRTLSDYVALVTRSKFMPIVCTSLACFLFQGMLMAYSSFLFINQLGLTPALYGLISIPVVTGCIMGQFPVLYLEKRHGLTAAFIFNSAVAVSALLFSLLYYAVADSHSIEELAVVILVFSIGFGGHTLLATRNVMAVFPSRRSHSSALMNFLDQFAGYIASVAVQLLFAIIGSAIMVHNAACAITIALVSFTTFIYIRTVKNNELSL